MIGPDGRKVVSYGALEKGDPRALNGDTVFEIGSVTKVFTSLLLSDTVQRGQVALTDPVSKYLAASVRLPQRVLAKRTERALDDQVIQKGGS